MGCTGSYATHDDFAQFWGYWQASINISAMTAQEIADLDAQIALAAGDIHIYLAQVDACACTLSAAAQVFLKKLNVVITAVTYRTPVGPRMSDDERKMWLEWIDDKLEKIRTGSLEMCTGYAGANMPAIAAAEIALTEWSEADIALNAMRRKRTP